MIFNGIDLSPYFRIKDIRGRGLINRNINTISIPGMDGEYVESVNTPSKILEVDIRIINNDLRKTIDELNDILATDEPVPIVFPDEPDMTYYGMVETSEESGERIHLGWHDATIYIRRSDPYKYGPEKEFEFQDSGIVENEGTAETDPIFELTATEKATFAMVSLGDEEYNLIGRPADVDEQIVDERTVVLDEVGDTIDTWQPAPGFNGTFVHGSQGIQVGNWGSGTGWHGPGAIKEIDPIQDFEIEFFVYVRSETPDRTFRISTNFYDENMNELGLLRLWDNSDKVLRKVVEARVGPYVGDFVNYLISSRNYDLREQRVWGGIIRVVRKGNVFTFYAARITQTGRHVETITQRFVDVNNDFAGKLKFIRIDIANYGNTSKPNEVAINRIRVTEHNQALVDETPYIIYPNDVITFDHKNDDILINGEPRNDLKNFGGSFFKLKKGENIITVTPEGSFETRVIFRERYR